MPSGPGWGNVWAVYCHRLNKPISLKKSLLKSDCVKMLLEKEWRGSANAYGSLDTAPSDPYREPTSM